MNRSKTEQPIHTPAGTGMQDDLPGEAQDFGGDEIVAAVLPGGTAAFFGTVVALTLDSIEVIACHITGNVLTVKTGSIEALYLGIALARRIN